MFAWKKYDYLEISGILHDPQRKNEVKTTKLNYIFLITDFWHGFSGMQFVFTSKKEKKYPQPEFLESIS